MRNVAVGGERSHRAFSLSETLMLGRGKFHDDEAGVTLDIKKEAAGDEKSDSQPTLIWSMFTGFLWLDNCVQKNLVARGWQSVSRTESQIMLLSAAGLTRPADLARTLGVSRQAINQVLTGMRERGLLELVPDEADRRAKRISFSEEGRGIREATLQIMTEMEAELSRRLGPDTLAQLQSVLDQDWGRPPLLEMGRD